MPDGVLQVEIKRHQIETQSHMKTMNVSVKVNSCGMIKAGITRWLSGKESGNVGDLGSVTGAGRSPGEGNGNPLQYSCLGNPMHKGVWQATYSPWGCRTVGH